MILRRIARTFFWTIEICGIFLVAASIVLLFLLSLVWLRSGIWPEYSFSMLLEDLHFPTWNSAQKIIDYFPQFPAWLAVPIVGGFAYAVGRLGNAIIDSYMQLSKNRLPIFEQTREQLCIGPTSTARRHFAAASPSVASAAVAETGAVPAGANSRQPRALLLKSKTAGAGDHGCRPRLNRRLKTTGVAYPLPTGLRP
jgi:hypothetical protein